jgi:glycosyltransferase involved in cell wall biosynthesis
MIHLFLNGSGASAGGGLTYLKSVIPQLSARNDVRVTVAVGESLRQSLGELPRVSFLAIENAANTAQRFWREQTVLPRFIRQSGAEVLISTGNFALRNSPIPQILLSRNSLYVSNIFSRDLLARGDYWLWVDTRIKSFLAKQSITWADRTIAPSSAFAEDLRKWTGRDVMDLHHGFDREKFFDSKSFLPADLEAKLSPEQGTFRLLFVSHYNYYRNFETLLRSIPVLREALAGQKIKLFLTCSLGSEENPGGYRGGKAGKLIRELGIQENVVELGTVPYHLLHHVYRACHLYVTPAYAESFAHPLIEAMASELPIIASDLQVHREVCGKSALYFKPFSPADLAQKAFVVARDSNLGRELGFFGAARSRDFSWRDHVERLVTLAVDLRQQKCPSRATRVDVAMFD